MGPRETTDKKTAGKAQSAAGDVTGEKLVVTCLIAGGRRRAGRRWDGGENKISADDLSEEQLKELDADPMFNIRKASKKD